MSQWCLHLRPRSAWPNSSIATLLSAAALLLVFTTAQLAEITAPTEGKVARECFDLY